MSIINQVLNELEQRGANTPLAEGAIRAVPPRRRLHMIRYVIVAMLLLGLLATALWNSQHQASRVPESVGVALAPASAVALVVSAPASAPVKTVALFASGVAAASQPVAALHGKPLLLVASEDESVAPEAKKSVRKQARRPLAANTEPDDSQEMENPELLKKISPLQRAESEFLKANLAVQEGRTNEALKGYESALLVDPTFKPARRAWVSALVSLKRNDEAEQVLRRGLKRDSHDVTFAMMLARLQVERDAVPEALETLQKTLPHAEDHSDYRSFVAALLQRLGRHEEAVAHYRAALKISPNNGVWWMGLGISLQALQRTEEARETYQRALATNSLNPQLQAFVQQKLKEL
jgi:MSHA biogenesis protein MshN